MNKIHIQNRQQRISGEDVSPLWGDFDIKGYMLAWSQGVGIFHGTT